MFEFLKSIFGKSEMASQVPSSQAPANRPYDPAEAGKILDYHISEVEEGRISNLAGIYSHLVSPDRKIVQKAASYIAHYVGMMNVRTIIRLDEMFRGYKYMSWPTDWRNVDLYEIKQKIDNDEDFIWVVRLGTFHYNGYYREKCIRYLLNDHASYIFLFLRVNDWVTEVRSAAAEALSSIGELKADELMACLSVLEKLRRSGRRSVFVMNDLDAKVADRIRALAPVFEWELIRKYDESTRRALYRILLDHNLLSKSEIFSILEHEKSPKCQLLMIAMFLDKYELSIEEIDRFLGNKSRIVQYKLLEQKYKVLGKPWDGIEEKLLSPARRIREYVGFILKKHTDFDCRSYYIQNLETPAKAVSILGIGETGRPEDFGLIMKYLDDENFRIVRNTVRALGALNPPEAEDILWKLLQDERIPVMVEAYRIILGHKIRYGGERLYTLFEQTESELLKKKIASLLIRETYWERLPYVLKLYPYKDDDIKECVMKGLVRGVNTYTGVFKDKAAQIEAILDDEQYGIPEKIKQNIRFNISALLIEK